MNITKIRSWTPFAALVICAALVSTTALAKTKTPFTATGVDTMVDPGTWITDGTSLFITGAVHSAVRNASDPRISGTGTVWSDGIFDLTTGAFTLWGRFHLENGGGAWDGYWQNLDGSLVLTAKGSGGYEGLVMRIGSDAGGLYIVENGPGEVPFKVSGWRVEQIQWVPGMVLDPFTMLPTGEVGVVGTVTLLKGAARSTHTGAVTDLMEVGLLTFTSPTTVAASVIGTEKAANGDLLNWVAVFETNLETGVANGTVHWSGGTGRFEAAIGSFGATINEQIDPATGEGTYAYSATGSIRY
jgi:hypothetical protein